MARVFLDPPRGVLFEIRTTQMNQMVRIIIIEYGHGDFIWLSHWEPRPPWPDIPQWHYHDPLLTSPCPILLMAVFCTTTIILCLLRVRKPQCIIFYFELNAEIERRQGLLCCPLLVLFLQGSLSSNLASMGSDFILHVTFLTRVEEWPRNRQPKLKLVQVKTMERTTTRSVLVVQSSSGHVHACLCVNCY